jgi:DNA-binding transcriptional ArsR family regulator
MPITRRRVTSAADMKALAHPVRLDVLDLLIVNGPMTASDAAVQLDQTPANVSWHLRKLAEHGFVRQATSGPGRRRPWKVVAESLSWSDDAEDEASASALRDVALEREVQRLRVALANAGQESAAWREATQVHQNRLWLTPDEAHEIGEQIRQLFLTRAEERQDPANRPADARVMALMAWVVPNGPADGPVGTVAALTDEEAAS